MFQSPISSRILPRDAAPAPEALTRAVRAKPRMISAPVTRSGSHPSGGGASAAVDLDHEGNMGLRVSLIPGPEPKLEMSWSGALAQEPRAESAQTIRALQTAIEVRVGRHRIRGDKIPVGGARTLPLDGPWGARSDVLDVQVRLGRNLGRRTIAQLRYAAGRSSFELMSGDSQLRIGAPVLRTITEYPHRAAEILMEADRATRESGGRAPSPSLDLHTHFGGALRADTILSVAERLKMPYPKSLLAEMGVDASKLEPASDREVRLEASRLEGSERAKLLDAMRISLFRVTTFKELEDIYKYRGPLVKHRPAFTEFLRALAEDYQKTGVKYVELSLSDIVNLDFLRDAHAVLPALERETGVAIRFKAAFWRHSDPVYNHDLWAKVKAIDSPYLVGIDFMGEETNSTRTFEDLIQQARRYSEKRKDGHFQIQVHAGESTAHPENVAVAIRAGATQIGHGLNGITEAVLQDALARGVTIELNLNSNLALSNVQRFEEVRDLVRRYISRGLKVSLGTDGHGMYQTSSRSERDAALYLGVPPEHLVRVGDHDLAYYDTMMEHFAREAAKSPELPERLPAGLYNARNWEADAARRKANVEKLITEAQGKGIVTLAPGAAREASLAAAIAYAPEKTPIFMLLPDGVDWLALEPSKQAQLAGLLGALTRHVDPRRALLITSGTILGADAVVHDAVARMPDGERPEILGLAPSNLPLRVLDGVTSRLAWVGHSWADRNGAALDLLEARGGVLLALGGGKDAKESLQEALNRQRGGRLPHLFFFDGACGELSKHQDKTAVQAARFDGLAGLERRLADDGLGHVLRVADATAPGTVEAQSWGANTEKKPLPKYFTDPRVLNYIQNHYHFAAIDRERVEAAERREPSPGERAIADYIDLVLNDVRPHPEFYKTVLSQEVIKNELEELTSSFGEKRLALDPRSIRRLFSRLTDAEKFLILKNLVNRSRNVLQAAAKLAIWEHEYGFADVDGAAPAIDRPMAQVQPEFEDPYARVETMQAKYRAFSTLDALKDTSSLGTWTLSGRRPDPKKGEPEDVARSAEEDRAFVASLEDRPFSPNSAAPRVFVMLRGVDGYNEYASHLKAKVDELYGEGSAFVFGTERHRTEIARETLPVNPEKSEQYGWSATRREFVQRNRIMATALLQRDAPVIIFSEMNKAPEFTEYFLAQADHHRRPVVAVKYGDLAFECDAGHMQKHFRDFLKPESQWYPSQKAGTIERLWVAGRGYPQVRDEDFEKMLGGDFEAKLGAMPTLSGRSL